MRWWMPYMIILVLLAILFVAAPPPSALYRIGLIAGALCCVDPFKQARYAAMIDQRRKSGQCLHCGYDLTGNLSGTCPECGSRAAAR